MRFVRLSAIAAPAVALMAFAFASPCLAESDWQKSYPVSAKPSITLSTGDVSTEVLPCSGCREVRVHVEWGERHSGEYMVSEFQTGDHVNFELKEKPRFG